MQQLISQIVPTLAIAAIYCIWFRANLVLRRRQRLLHERVAYMLWVAATEA